MILSSEELELLRTARHSTPHQLLGMHPMGQGRGVVARAFLPHARGVRVLPVHDKSKPSFELQRVHPDGLYEGVSDKSQEVYAYDLEISHHDGSTSRGRDPYSFLPTVSDRDLYYFNEGTDRELYRKLGSHIIDIDGARGTGFAVWAPNARRVSIVGPFNDWDGRRHVMRSLGVSGVWELFVPGLDKGTLYKYEVVTCHGDIILKTDPFAVFFETPPKNASIVWETGQYYWTDQNWMENRRHSNPHREPISIYEVHLGSWRKSGAGESPGYREVAPQLISYLKSYGFTHVEFLPLAEHAYYPSWGYQVTGFYAPTSRYGTPEDLQFLINELHKNNIGVILDWVPAHFPRDAWALSRFDGTCLYEHEDPRLGAHMDWGTLVFNYGRKEVANFLMANALYWLDHFHIDGLRVDAVASMLYLDYSRKDGEWIPNQFGGRENLDAIQFIRDFNHAAHTQFPGILTIAEESTAWPMVSRPPESGGLGFSFKWNMGWMNDTLRYFSKDSIYRKFHQNELTFAMVYHHGENFILPLSHDEVVHGKRSLLGKMPGDDWQRFANLRALLAYQWFFPGKKLLFMGGEIGQSSEWSENQSLEWWLLTEGPYHKGAQQMMKELNNFYRHEAALYESDYDHAGFYWIDCSDSESCVLSFVRQTHDGLRKVCVILNLTPVPRAGYRIGVPEMCSWVEFFNSDSTRFGGAGQFENAVYSTDAIPMHGQQFSVEFSLPPLSVIAFIPDRMTSSE